MTKRFMMNRLPVVNLLSPAAMERPVVFSMKPAKVTLSLKNFSHSSPRIENAWAGAVIKKITQEVPRQDTIRLKFTTCLLARCSGSFFPVSSNTDRDCLLSLDETGKKDPEQ